MITNAKDRRLNQNTGTLPDVSGAILNRLQPMQFTKIVKTVEGFQTIETPTTIDTKASMQPLSKRDLMMKPEGQRMWDWQQLHALPGFNLVPDEVVKILGVQYRVMGVWNYERYGFMEYHLVNDFTGSGP